MATAFKILSIAIKQLAKPVSKIFVERAQIAAEQNPDALLCRFVLKSGELLQK